MKDIGVYIHIPFCKSKCTYCDFISFDKKQDLIINYINALKNEIYLKSIFDQDSENYNITTIYIGGGTPSFIESKYILDILKVLRDNYTVSKDAEISIEMNPGTVTKQKLLDYKKAGINRLSLGLQSGNDRLLKLISRIHTYQEYEESIKLAKEVGFNNINSDIIIGIPTQTIEDVEDTINKLLKLDLTHISIYSLILEEGTIMEKDVSSGKLKLIDDEIERYIYWYAKRRLEKEGFIHYEISNFAKPGYFCKHNLDCWKQKEYLGFGVASSSYSNDCRYKNIDDINKYIKNLESNQFRANIELEEKQNKQSKMDEYMILNLRTLSGVKVSKFKELFNESPYRIYYKKIEKLVNNNLLVLDYDNIKLSKKGLDLANIVWQEFI